VLAVAFFLVVLFIACLAVAPAAQAAVGAFVRSDIFVAAVLATGVGGLVPSVVWATEKSAAQAQRDAETKAQRTADVAAQAQRDAAQAQRDAEAKAQREADVAAQAQRDAEAKAQREADKEELQKALTQLASSADVWTRRLSSAFTGLERVRALAVPSAPPSLCSWPASRLAKWFADSEHWQQYGPAFARHDGWAVTALTHEGQLVELGVLEEHAGALLADLRSIR
jgi:Skp family chaperone for outer membrane proteins